jgi:hypothetical protein
VISRATPGRSRKVLSLKTPGVVVETNVKGQVAFEVSLTVNIVSLALLLSLAPLLSEEEEYPEDDVTSTWRDAGSNSACDNGTGK